MNPLLFNAKDVLAQIKHARSCEKFRPTFTESEDGVTPTAALLLVGDQGVYLMSNGIDEDKPREGVAYARGINPDVDDFDSWWSAKRTACGGDDFVDRLPDDWMAAIETAATQYIEANPDAEVMVEILVSEDSLGLGRIGVFT